MNSRFAYRIKGWTLPLWLPASAIAIVCSCFGFSSTGQQAGGRVTGQSETKRAIEVQQSSGQAPQAVSAQESPARHYFTERRAAQSERRKDAPLQRSVTGQSRDHQLLFATCQGSCLPMNRNLEKVQQALGEHIGKDVFILSFSVDPTVDTPASLKEYAKKLHARPGWFFLTGEKQNVDLALNKLGQFVSDKQDHLNIFIIGNERTGLWKKAFGLAQSDELVKVVESVLNDKPAGDK